MPLLARAFLKPVGVIAFVAEQKTSAQGGAVRTWRRHRTGPLNDLKAIGLDNTFGPGSGPSIFPTVFRGAVVGSSKSRVAGLEPLAI